MAAATGVLVALTGCGEYVTPPLTVTGDLALSAKDAGSGTGAALTDGGPCVGTATFDDINDATKVTVTDDETTVLGTTTLGPGTFAEASGECRFHFVIPDVEADHPYYGVEVAHRGVVRYEGDDIETPNLSLGS